MEMLPTLESLIGQLTWNKRYQIMANLLHHSPEARKLIVEALTVIKVTKDLSFGERKMLDNAYNYDEYMKELNKKVIKLENYRKTS